jgi:penicillin-insensitive murein endopeptidase
MPKAFSIVISAAAFFLSSFATAQWHKFTSPSTDPAYIAGGYANGCVAGAATLPEKGKGYVTMRPSRNRNYGHSNLVHFIQELGMYSFNNGFQILIGDMSQPRGGPMNFGHRSHQIGLDVDIWFQIVPSGANLSKTQRNKRDFVSVIDKKKGVLANATWRKQYVSLLKKAVSSSQVARIFVNPVIKNALCESENEAEWLRKLRPWYGHDEHFHVRLSCPPGMPECKDQAPIPVGSGCGIDLRQWVYDQANPKPIKPKTKPSKPQKKKILPSYCRVLAG